MTSFTFVPRSSATPLSPLTPMTGFAASRGNFKQDMLRLVTESAMPLTTSRVQPTLGGRTISTCVPKVRPLHGMSSAPHSVNTTSPRVLWTINVRSSATSPKVEGLLTSTAVSSTGWPVTQPKRSPPTPRSRKGCKARYAVLFQIRTFPPEPEDEAHIGPTATYDEVIYPGFQHDITTLQIQGYTSHTNGIQVPEYNTTAEYTCLSTDYKQMPSGKGKTHQAHVTRVQALRPGP